MTATDGEGDRSSGAGRILGQRTMLSPVDELRQIWPTRSGTGTNAGAVVVAGERSDRWRWSLTVGAATVVGSVDGGCDGVITGVGERRKLRLSGVVATVVWSDGGVRSDGFGRRSEEEEEEGGLTGDGERGPASGGSPFRFSWRERDERESLEGEKG
ncbi:hypothetical protein FXO37_06475 [Capsicum annuum]|nr:hypothetical protein FXO37_06475 [Capsicum annuum]